MPDAFFQAHYYTPPRIFGRRLLPFSVSHYYLLSTLGNAWLYGEGKRAELFAAVLICSQTDAQNRLALFGGRLSVWRTAAWIWLWRKASLDVAGASFRQYIEDSTRTPDRWESDGDKSGARQAVPFAYYMIKSLCEYYGYNEREAWDVAIAKARALYDTVAESMGDDKLITASEQRAIEEARAG